MLRGHAAGKTSTENRSAILKIVQSDEAVASISLVREEDSPPMPMYYFNLRNQDKINDVDGTELADTDAAREHADVVAKELMFKSDKFMDEAWSRWSMHVHDDEGLELFSFRMSDVKNSNGT